MEIHWTLTRDVWISILWPRWLDWKYMNASLSNSNTNCNLFFFKRLVVSVLKKVMWHKKHDSKPFMLTSPDVQIDAILLLVITLLRPMMDDTYQVHLVCTGDCMLIYPLTSITFLDQSRDYPPFKKKSYNYWYKICKCYSNIQYYLLFYKKRLRENFYYIIRKSCVLSDYCCRHQYLVTLTTCCPLLCANNLHANQLSLLSC